MKVRAQVKARLASSYSPDALRKGMAKAGRWMKAAYGSVDWEAAAREMGVDEVVSMVGNYAAESAANVVETYNRLDSRSRRRA